MLERMIVCVGGGDTANWNNHGKTLILSSGSWQRGRTYRTCNHNSKNACSDRVAGHTVVSHDNEVYVIGGDHSQRRAMFFSPIRACACVMVWNSETNTWRGIPSLNQARALTGACSYRGRICVVGGIDSMCCGDDLCTAEVYGEIADGIPG